MPGKHVHFSPASYAGSSTPSPTFSTSTLEHTPGPFTPPSLGYGSPYHSVPLPGVATALHPMFSPHTSVIQYNLTLAPETMKPLARFNPSEMWALPASKPPVPFMEISCHSLPWRITVMPRSASTGYVTIGDVFYALYRALRTNVSPQEFALVRTAEERAMINMAYRVRYKSQPDNESYQAEKAKGLKRVDFLGPHTQFMGLMSVNEGTDGWILVVS